MYDDERSFDRSLKQSLERLLEQSLSARCDMLNVIAAPDFCRGGEHILFLAFLDFFFKLPKIGLSHKKPVFSKL